MIGGFLGQLMVVLNTISIHFEAMIDPKRIDEAGSLNDILSPIKIQTFIYDFV